jgi:hypothetical protein
MPFVAALLTVGLMLLVAHGPAFAQTEGPIVVAEFDGAKKQSIRDLVVDLLRAEGYEVVSEPDAPRLSASDAQFVEVAKKGGYRAFVLGNTELDKKAWSTSITIREGKTGKAIGSVVIESGWYPGLQKALKSRLISHVSGPLNSAEAPPKATPKATPVVLTEEKPRPAPQEPEPEEPAQTKEKAEEAAVAEEAEEEQSEAESQPAEPEDKPNYSRGKSERFNNLELDAGMLFVQRAWVISDSLSGTLDGPISPTHDVSMMGIKVGGAIYPVGFASKSFARHIGIEGTFLRSFYGQTPLLNAQGGDDTRDTIFQEYTASLRGRIPAGSLQIGVFGGVGGQSLTLAGEKEIAALPDADYGFFRGGVDLMVPFNKSFSAKGGFAYRATYTLGKDPAQIQDELWFPKARSKAIEVTLQADYALSKQWALRLGGFLSRYALAFNPDPASVQVSARANNPSPPIAGGAVDLYAGGTLSAVFMLQ